MTVGVKKIRCSHEISFRVATHEEIVHRVRSARHVGRDGLIRPSIAHETWGLYLFEVSVTLG